MGFQQGLSGLNAASADLNIIGNNVSNANTVGFKQSEGIFADVYANALLGGSGTNIGIGTTLQKTSQEFGQGNIETSSNPLDMAINGSGFFVLSNNGTTQYSRNGQFQLNKNGIVVNSAGLQVTGYGVDSSGHIVAANPQPLQISSNNIAPAVTTKAGATLNLDSTQKAPTTATFSISDPTSYNNATSMTTYDTLGNPHTLTTYFVKTASDTWNVYGASDGVAIGSAALGKLTFNSAGAIDTTKTTLPFNVSVPLTNGATTPLAYALDFTGSTQYGSAFGVTQLTQDGSASGQLSGFSVGPDGIVQGNYSNGQTRTLGQLVLANFNNPQGLQPLGNNVWGATSDSGQPLVGAPQSGALGAIKSGATEASNVDLTAQLVNMITAQKIYQANAQTIKAQEAILNTLVTLQ